eukprot:13221747-Ditylum_brightwellii.AAC.1
MVTVDCSRFSVIFKNAQDAKVQSTSEDPDIVHVVHYENALHDSDGEVAKIVTYMGVRVMCKAMRRGSVVGFKNDEQITSQAKTNR